MDLEKRMEMLKRGLQRHKWTIDYLDKHVRLHQWIGLVASCLVAVLVAWIFWPDSKTVEAGKFVLRDRKGKIRGVWRMTEGYPEIGMKAMDGRELRLALGEKAAGFGVFDSNGMGRFVAGVVVSDSRKVEIPIVSLHSAENETEVKIVGQGEPKEFYGLRLVDSSGKVRGEFGVLNDDDEPMLSFFDSEERFRTMLIFRKDGKSRFVHYDEKDRILWSAPTKSK